MQKISSQNQPNGEVCSCWHRGSPTVHIGNDILPLNRLLDTIDARLLASRFSLSQRLSLALTKITYIGTMQPEGFTAPTKIYAVKGSRGLFISYRQGHSEAIYDIAESPYPSDRRGCQDIEEAIE